MTSIARSTTQLLPFGTAAGVGVGGGAATMWLQNLLPGSWNTVANSGAVWALVAFAAAAVLRVSARSAALVGALVLLGEVAGYYVIAAPLNGVASSRSEQLLWTMAALWIGPLAGVGGRLCRCGTPAQRGLSIAGVCGMLAGEGSYLNSIDVPVSGTVELGIAIFAGLVTPALLRLRPATAAAVLAAGAGAAGAVYTAYRYIQP